MIERDGWKSITFGEVCKVKSGKNLPKSKQVGDDYLVYGGNGIAGSHNEYLFEETQLIIGRVGAQCGNTHITKPKSWITDNAFVVDFDPDLYDINFLWYLIQDLNLIKYSKSTAQPVISGGGIKNIGLQVPSLPEQRAIVAKLEVLLGELDRSVGELEVALGKLGVYRQSVLKEAFGGRLTEAIMPLQQLGNHATLITKGSSPKWQGFDYIKDASQLRFITSENVREGHLDLTKEKYLPLGFNEVQTRSILESGDVLFNLVGASIGRAAEFKNVQGVCNINQAVALIRPEQSIDARYLVYYLNSATAKQDYLGDIVETARANLSLKNVRELQIPLPSLPEQHQIVAEIESRLSVVDALEREIVAALERVKGLRMGVLKRAFGGELLTSEKLENLRDE